MDPFWKTILWNQCGAAIDTLDNVIEACPNELWGDRSKQPEFWYVAYHTVYFLDFYWFGTKDRFTPREGYTLSELDPSGVLPDRVYSKAELREYLADCRTKYQTLIENMTDESAQKLTEFWWPDMSVAELLIQTIRHLQHHAAQLNLILRRETDAPAPWLTRPKAPLTQ